MAMEDSYPCLKESAEPHPIREVVWECHKH
jgi:hypothetical protein